MRSENEIREFYRDYVNRYAIAEQKKDVVALNQYKGAAVACGRTLGKDLKRILLDLQIAVEFIKRENSRT